MELKIKNNTYSLKWGLFVLEQYSDAVNCDLDEITSTIISDVVGLKTAIKNVRKLILASLDVNYENHNVTDKDIADLMDESGFKLIGDVTDSFANSLFLGSKVSGELEEEHANDDAPKKKATRKREY